MGPTPDTVESNTTLPAEVDVVIVGGGIIGVSTALYLHGKGLRVAVCEKGHIAGEQSSRNWGWVRVTHRDMREFELSIESLKLWRTIDQTLGIDTGFRQAGILYAAGDAAAMERHQIWLNKARALAPGAFDTREVDGKTIQELAPQASQRFVGGLYTPSDGRAEPQKAAPAIANALRRSGVSILTPCAVRGIETSAGRVSAVVTEHGTIRCSAVVAAGGAWTRLFCGNIDIALPQLLVKASVLRTEPIEGGPSVNMSTRRMAFRKRVDGGYTIAPGFRTNADITPDSFRLFFKYIAALKSQIGMMKIGFGSRFFEELARPRRWALDKPTVFETIRTLDPQPTVEFTDAALLEFKQLLPALRSARLAQRWAGYMDVTPDAIPVISGVASVPGLFIGTGFSGHGFGIGLGAGKLLADLVNNDTPLVNPHAFRLSRFSDGSKMHIDAGF